MNYNRLRSVCVNRLETSFAVSWIFEKDFNYDCVVQFSCFQRFSNCKGNGRKALRLFLFLAQLKKQHVLLFTTVPKLYSYYESFDFTEIVSYRKGNYRLYIRYFK